MFTSRPAATALSAAATVPAGSCARISSTTARSSAATPGSSSSRSVSRVTHGVNEHTLELFGEKGALAYRLVRSTPRWYEGELRAQWY